MRNFARFNTAQGTFAFVVYPLDLTGTHYIIDFAYDDDNYIKLYYTSSSITFILKEHGITHSCTGDTSGWVTENAYGVVCRFSTENEVVSGANMALSIGTSGTTPTTTTNTDSIQAVFNISRYIYGQDNDLQGNSCLDGLLFYQIDENIWTDSEVNSWFTNGFANNTVNQYTKQYLAFDNSGEDLIAVQFPQTRSTDSNSNRNLFSDPYCEEGSVNSNWSTYSSATLSKVNSLTYIGNKSLKCVFSNENDDVEERISLDNARYWLNFKYYVGNNLNVTEFEVSHSNGYYPLTQFIDGSLNLVEIDIQHTDTNSYTGTLYNASHGYALYSNTTVSTSGFTSSTSIGVTHNLATYPLVQVIDSGGNVLMADVSHTDTNSFTVTLDSAETGTVLYSTGTTVTFTGTTKTVSHNAGLYPIVQVLDDSLNLVEADVSHVDTNSFTVTVDSNPGTFTIIYNDDVVNSNTDDLFTHTSIYAKVINSASSTVLNEELIPTLSSWNDYSTVFNSGASGTAQVKPLIQTVTGSNTIYLDALKLHKVTLGNALNSANYYVRLDSNYDPVETVKGSDATHTSSSDYYILLDSFNMSSDIRCQASPEAKSYTTDSGGYTDKAFIVDGGDILSNPVTNVISAKAGAIAMKLNPILWDASDYMSNGYLFSIPNKINIYFNSSDSKFYATFYNSTGGTTTCSSSAQSFSRGTFFKISVEWDADSTGNTISIYVDNPTTSVGTSTTTWDAPDITSGSMYWLSDSNGENQFNAAISNRRIYARPLTDSERTTLFNTTWS